MTPDDIEKLLADLANPTIGKNNSRYDMNEATPDLSRLVLAHPVTVEMLERWEYHIMNCPDIDILVAEIRAAIADMEKLK